MTTKEKNSLLDALHAFHPASKEPAWLADLRSDAAGSFQQLGVPNLRHEEWRYTSLKPLLSLEFSHHSTPPVTAAALEPFVIPGADKFRLVFVNGQYSPGLSRIGDMPRGVLIQPLSRVVNGDEGLAGKLARYADHHAQPFAALNLATLADGAYLRAGKGARVETPVHVIHVSAGGRMTSPRLFLLAGENAELNVIESFVGLGEAPRFVNGVSEIALQQGAQVRHVRMLQETDATVHIGWNEVRQDRDSHYFGHSLSLSAGLARNDVNAMLTGEGAHCTLNGLVIGGGRQHIDNHLVVDHIRPHCTSNQLYRSVVDDKSRSVFGGKVIVRPGAVGTDAQQQNNNLLLSDDARADTKPQLEIYCDEVKCAHGATSGQLDAEAMFFLRSRGLDYGQARNVLTYAFANDVVEHIKLAPAREYLEEQMRRHFQGLLGE